jgi:multidrug efflux system outer membrane protein
VIEMNARRELFVVGLLAISSPGCTVGPDYKRPAVTVPADYRGASPDRGREPAAASFGDEKWWNAFLDEALRDLIQTALERSFDVRIAAARVLEARAQLGIARADQLPSVAASASVAHERSPVGGGPIVETTVTQGAASLAWELDFWGKFRRATESTRAALLGQEWAQRQVVTSLVADVASAYFQLREMDLELEISRRTLASRRDSLALTQTLADRGATSMLDVRQAEQLVFAAAASIPDLEGRIEQQENFINVLLGKNPESIARGRKLVDQTHPLEVPAGLPSSLLERRPDIRQAEQQLIAANAQVGVARAEFFPQISLTAAGGFLSSALSGLFSGPSGTWTFGGSAAQPVFEGGRIRNRVAFAEARREEASLAYQQVVQQAFRDVSDALVGYRKSREFRIQQEQLTRSAEDAANLSSMRYKGGATSYLEVLDSDTRHFSAQLSLAQAQLRELQSLVRIYRALGGGWEQ